MKKLLFFTLVFLLQCLSPSQNSAMAAENFSTLEERMTGKELLETGLNKLSEEELAALNEWIRRHSVATLENASARPASSASGRGADTRGFELKNKGGGENRGKVIHSHIVGKFDGWRGKQTLFKLDNGMIWKQAENDTFAIREVSNPEVTIKKGIMGTWRLSVVGYSSSVRVKRIQ